MNRPSSPDPATEVQLSADLTANVDRTQPMPLHAQIRQHLSRVLDVQEGNGVGLKLPSEHDLARRYGVSVAPVRQALLELMRVGRVARRSGSGTFVTEGPIDDEISVLSSFTKSLKNNRAGVLMQVAHLGTAALGVEMAAALGVEVGTPAVELERVGVVAGTPVVVLASFLPSRIVPGLEQLQIEGGSLYELLDQNYQIRLTEADSVIDTVYADESDSRRFGIPVSTVMMRVSGVAKDQHGRLVEAFEVRYRSGWFRLRFHSINREGEVIHMRDLDDTALRSIPSPVGDEGNN